MLVLQRSRTSMNMRKNSQHVPFTLINLYCLFYISNMYLRRNSSWIIFSMNLRRKPWWKMSNFCEKCLTSLWKKKTEVFILIENIGKSIKLILFC
jgi:hypothetical protein